MNNVIIEAAQFAAKAHEGQYRKYSTGVPVPYIFHPIRVAGIVATHPQADERMVAAAYLHDVLEDTQCTSDALKEQFDEFVTCMVECLTNPSKQFKDRPRAERKAMDRAHLKEMPWSVKFIKLADRLDNIMDMNECVLTPKDFDALYRSETVELYKVLAGTDVDLERRLVAAVERVKL